MTDPLPCDFCKEAPALQRFQKALPHSFSYKCVSKGCEGRIVESHRSGTIEGATELWNVGRKD